MIRQWLEKLGWYDYLRYSSLYHQLLRFRNPKYFSHLKSDVNLYRGLLGARLDLAIDIGANFGDKTWSLRQLAQHVVCIEPDAACCRALRIRFRKDPNVTIVNAAVGRTAGEATLYIEQEGSAYNTLSEKQRDWVTEHKSPPCAQTIVKVITLDEIIQQFGMPDFVKIDVEGFEKEVFEGLSCELPAVCFEANLPRFLTETISILERLNCIPSRVNFRDGDRLVFKDFISINESQEYIASLDDKDYSFDIFVFR